ncbi:MULTISPECIES: hypothetical protein [unclassified Paraburkholderia]|uniref:hypothetical protein n=1 Tax=unclassified Paraburkholderia TaxID=2615204 RepID=UPI0016151E78|nr:MULTISPECIES: hypothetical protein [unclassified Paraburkholderia]MBB5442066.1 hypothetical protein [Paraburkholderia sp. WSM4177]MBB5482462.1 hypothetical protein [Paraburkholderia sp. WSM4180]
MPRYKVPFAAFQRALELARSVDAGNLKAPFAERALREEFPEMSPRAAQGYIGSYLAMRRGTQRFGTTIAADAWRLYLADIANLGPGQLSVALDAFLSHIVYL